MSDSHRTVCAASLGNRAVPGAAMHLQERGYCSQLGEVAEWGKGGHERRPLQLQT